MSIRTTLNTDFQKLAQRALRNGIEEYDRRQGYRGAVFELETLEAWWEQLTEVDIPTDLAPWRLAVVLSVDEEENHANIGLRPRMTRARSFEDRIDLGVIDLAGVTWARAKPSPENGYKIKGPRIKRMSQVVKTGDVVWVSQKSDDEIYELKQLPEVNGAMVALDPHTGRVLAMTGGYSFSASEFNRATKPAASPARRLNLLFMPPLWIAALRQPVWCSTRLLLWSRAKIKVCGNRKTMRGGFTAFQLCASAWRKAAI